MVGDIADRAFERCDHASERTVALSHLQRRDQFVALLRGLELLGLEHIGIGLRAVERRSARRHGEPSRRRARPRFGRGRRCACSRCCCDPNRLGQFVRSVIFERRPLDVGLGALHLRACRRRLGRGREIAPCASIWRREPLDRRVLDADAGPRRIDRVSSPSSIETNRAPFWTTWPGGPDLGGMPGRLDGYDRGQSPDIGVVGRDEEPPLDDSHRPSCRMSRARRGSGPERRTAQAGPLG